MTKLKLFFTLFTIAFCSLPKCLKAQKNGDTLFVKAWNYGTNNRDTTISFPSKSLTFEKIIMRYSMRCKNGLVSDQTNRNKGCGEWDYSCNTFLVDSTKIETVLQTTPSYVISNFTGNSFKYAKRVIYDYYDYAQDNIQVTSANNEKNVNIGSGNNLLTHILKTDENSGKTQILYRAGELINAGFDSGLIHGILFKVLNGGTANFLKIKVKNTNLASLSSSNFSNSGFTEVYNQTVVFSLGTQKINFLNPFLWDGKSNLMIELSFTNSVPSNPVILEGFTDTTKSVLTANNNYAVDFMNQGHIELDASNLTSISKELTISFWAYGDPNGLPTNTSVIYGWAADKNQRQLNIHFPWSDGSVYFDCGFAAGNYDRINKAATAAEYKGNWNHWAFTKNATTGNMSVYLNGTLWLSGASKTKAISLMNVILGKDQALNNNYKGRLSELSIWNKVLNVSEIKSFMNAKLDSNVLNFENLVAYYPFYEGQGLLVNDFKSGLKSTGSKISWTFERGVNINRSFVESKEKPNIQLFRGEYTVQISKSFNRDSIARKPNVIEKYSIISTESAGLPIHDIVKLDTTLAAFEATSSKIFNGETGQLLDTILNPVDGVFFIVNLNYEKRFPWYHELMSFVTPYGLGLDLGINGKSWYYDMSDFAPLLNGNKRLMMTMGGQNQEQMEVEFMFILGTPIANVLEFNQLWQGGARLGGPSIGSILNNSVFPPINYTPLANGKLFKMRSSITGHGSDGEFEQNGGSIYHFLNIGGGSTEFNWSVNIDCSSNPMIAQGGTWLIPRQGWCPGLRTKLVENDFTPYLTSGTETSIDYHISEPSKTSGDYRYIVAHQLVTYGDPNFNLDARIVDIKQPTGDYEYAKTNPICAQPVILIQNSGKNTINSVQFEYWANNSTVKQSWTWTGTLNYMDTVSVKLPSWGLWDNGMLPSNNRFNCSIVKVNQVADDYSQNNFQSSAVTIPNVIPGSFKIELRTNNNPNENSLTLYDVDGKIVINENYSVANKVHSYPLELNGCYKLVVSDAGQDGLSWWANTAQGTGLVRIRNGAGTVIKTFNADFGSFFEFNFTTNYALNVSRLDLNQSINLYPNPANQKFILDGEALNNSSVRIVNLMGQRIQEFSQISENKLEIYTQNWKQGIYLVEITKGNLKATKKLVVQ